jgi:hypothetical protein
LRLVVGGWPLVGGHYSVELDARNRVLGSVLRMAGPERLELEASSRRERSASLLPKS